MAYRCSQCGDLYDDDDPPCERCGNQYFEEVSDVVESTGDHVWVCTECERVHVKHSPPCSRCGNHTLEKRSQDYDLADAVAPSYADLASPQYVAAAAGLVVVLALFGLVVLGVVPLPEFLGGHPSVSNVPGEADTASGISLAATETALVERLNDERTAAGVRALNRSERLGEMATYYTQKRVKADYADADQPETRGLARRFDYRCPRSLAGATVPVAGSRLSISNATSAHDLGTELGDRFAASALGSDGDRRAVGVDVHVAPDGTVYATAFAC